MDRSDCVTCRISIPKPCSSDQPNVMIAYSGYHGPAGRTRRFGKSSSSPPSWISLSLPSAPYFASACQAQRCFPGTLSPPPDSASDSSPPCRSRFNNHDDAALITAQSTPSCCRESCSPVAIDGTLTVVCYARVPSKPVCRFTHRVALMTISGRALLCCREPALSCASRLLSKGRGLHR